ncbi:MAG: cytochrome P450 [bacterium]
MAVFNPFRPNYIDDPYPILDRLRSTEPVLWSADLGAWVLTAYGDCLRVLQDDDSFSSDPVNAGGEFGSNIAQRRAEVPLGRAPIMGNTDQPEHTRLRAVVNRAFTPRAIEAQRERLSGRVAELLALTPANEPLDVVAHLAEPLAVTSVLDYLGFPLESLDQVRTWSLMLMRARAEGGAQPGVLAAAETARDEMLGFLAEMAEARDVEAEGRETVLSVLLDACDEGTMQPDEMLMMIIHISLAGNGPTAMAVGNAAWVLSQHPDAQAWLRSNPEATPTAVEELLRFETATHFIARFALTDVKIGSRTIRAGQQVHVMLGAANRDPARFPDPANLDLQRTDNRQLAFGFGIHFCLGAPLARLELETAVRHLLERYPTGFQALNWRRGGSYQVRGFQNLLIG